MPQAPVPTYRVEYDPSRGSWLLTGPVGAKQVTQSRTLARMKG
ncbi:hypothetical protein N8621_02410 [Akkermansiaceae bacterium]|nr:hypothetical protein [Akkermansiaceae bacterium]MDA7646189.1 hypothetical protein [bacterium]MDA7656465.1 hypothetical protein [Akkermansiaceae bacterium]MDB4812648.1 hypothetical protein [Akkermansiaceae bacterium]